ncbi:MAG: glutamine-hydrolyzing carbamoyl-phosphate synthase small subunit [Deltaproteobacteria bacterium]|nr:glutamine-hydrolyzing carbamoyl-phosphate synthase small subunit [Deltaproteobacteria bacterium]
MRAYLALEDGLVLSGRSFTGPGEATGEVVFNTSMTGYQEILTDPSYKGQIVTMTYPLMGNYGVNLEDTESSRVQVEGFIVKEYHPYPSNWRSQGDLAAYLKQNRVLGIEGLDTRAATKHLREVGAMRGIISTEDLDPESLIRRARQLPRMEGLDLVRYVTCAAPYWWPEAAPPPALDLSTLWAQRRHPKIIAYDFGVKFNILRRLAERGMEILVVPAMTPAAEILALEPAGIVLSNGPGDPAVVTYAIENTRQCLGVRPLFGICLGHQLLGLALGGRTFKLKFGHRGANQPVKNLLTGRVEITSQNHGFAVDSDSIPDPEVELTHINLNDGTLEGLRHRRLQAFSVQYHPEASPGPHDAGYLFDEFIKILK